MSEGYPTMVKDTDLLAGVVDLVKRGWIQNDIRDRIGHTQGQKMYHIAILDARFPEFEIVKKFIDGEWCLKKARHTAVIELNHHTDPKWLARQNNIRGRTKPGFPKLKMLRSTEVLEYFNGLATVLTKPKRVINKRVAAIRAILDMLTAEQRADALTVLAEANMLRPAQIERLK